MNFNMRVDSHRIPHIRYTTRYVDFHVESYMHIFIFII
jgi:hypothetical protein